MNFNYVFFWGKEDYYHFAFADIVKLENVKYIDGLPRTNGILLKCLHKLHMSRKINRCINIPFKNIWFQNYFVDNFSITRPIIFIFHASYYHLRGANYFDYLKKQYPDSKCVFFFTDTVESYRKIFKDAFASGFDIDYLKEKCDYILTYNKLDAYKYKFIYYPSPYSKVIQHTKECPQYDVFFVGRAKDRLSEIHKAFCTLNDKNFKNDFYVIGVSKDKMLTGFEGLHYNQFLTYEECLQHIFNAKGILEIVQKGTDGFTFRLHEALIYDKNLITDNPIVHEIPYGKSQKIFFYKDIEKINKKDFDATYKESYHYKNEYSPINLLKFLEKLCK